MSFVGESNYWLDTAGPAPTDEGRAMPAKVDVAVVGAGYTGLAAALSLARAGRSVAVFDAEAVGFGASSRNGGMVGPGLHKLGIGGLVRTYGEERAIAILGEGLKALDHLEGFVAEEGIDCDLAMTGRFRGARTAAQYEASGRECDWLQAKIGLPTHHVSRADQRSEIGSDFYRGGVVYERDGGVNPRKLLLGLAARAAEAGVQIIAPCAVTGLQRDGSVHTVQTARGAVEAREVVLATNGYSDARSAALSRRVVPLETGACAVGPLSPEQMAELTPKGRMHGETGRVFMWYRPTPDGRSFIFGGRFGAGGMGLEARRRAFRRAICRVFPQLETAPISHVWSGQIAYTADHSPHLGQHDDVWMAGGYCGSGVTRSLYFGSKLARRMLGQADADTAFDTLPFKPVPLRPLAPLAAGMLVRWYQMQDNRELRARE
ncbi:FAD-dependent oxidoreductase [Pelagivirga sediminicola]|uniref:FAD-dependent oxidoreductase n=1 Tax=Pelagivirga sediminicola TaxID=2170575 RepID=A0A2T7G7Y3_9RHOB|nr:FAD-binding oxidoreductase [Pelagivirga sediminicola]PVA10533.1 FAD-dependent oxidoreductase [Pelagivirga sediminicola]